MHKTPKQVTKDPSREERGKISDETYMKRLKEGILRDNPLFTSSSTDNSTPSTGSSTPSTSSSTNNFTTRSSDTYIYGVDIVAALAIGACVFFVYNKISSRAANKDKSFHSVV